MGRLNQTVHPQFLGLVLAAVGSVLTACISGVNDWRVWYVDDLSIVTSGMAWVGIWRACFYSHALDTLEFCRGFGITDSFVPPEIRAAQVLCMLAIPLGIAGNLVAGYAVKRVYRNAAGGRIRLLFVFAGALYFCTASCTLVPVFWNMCSVLDNRTIDFPPEYHLPPAPYKQELGLGIVIGMGSSFLLIVSGLLFLLYRTPNKPQNARDEVVGTEGQDSSVRDPKNNGLLGAIGSSIEGKENPAFKAEENL